MALAPLTSYRDMRSLLLLPKYSDLQILCQKINFSVHKAIVCSQSPVLAADIDGDFVEARENTIHIQGFDAWTVKCMIFFMYGAEYELAMEIESPSPPTVALISDLQKDLNAEDIESSVVPIPRTLPCSTDILLRHIQVNAIADYYNVPKLKELANAKINAILENEWSSSGFLDVVQNAFERTSDADLHKIIITATSLHIEDLMVLEDFSRLSVMGDKCFEVLQNSVMRYQEKVGLLNDRLTAVEFSFDEAKSGMELAKISAEDANNTAKAMMNNFIECAGQLNKNKICRNINCGADFSCFIEQGGTAEQAAFKLRCRKCKCKHT